MRLRHLKWIRVSLVTLAVLKLLALRSVSAQTYRVTDLGDLGGGISSTSVINNNGQVVG
jgi:hypothetical protein